MALDPTPMAASIVTSSETTELTTDQKVAFIWRSMYGYVDIATGTVHEGMVHQVADLWKLGKYTIKYLVPIGGAGVIASVANFLHAYNLLAPLGAVAAKFIGLIFGLPF